MSKTNFVAIVSQQSIHDNAVKHGWWDDPSPNIPEKLCMIHAEVSEAVEAFRQEGSHDTALARMAEELADVVILTFSLAEHLGIDMASAILTKHTFNQARPYRHGGKKC